MIRSRSDRPTARALAILALVSLLAALGGCSDDGSDPTGFGPDAGLVGSYVAGVDGDDAFGAIVFTADTADISRDVIAEGGSIRLELRPDGTTAGRLFVPDPAVADGSNDFEADLGGTWTESGGIVTLDQPADTFLRDLPFQAADDRLIGDETFGGVRVRVVLERAD